jgi:hypothetical protein
LHAIAKRAQEGVHVSIARVDVEESKTVGSPAVGWLEPLEQHRALPGTVRGQIEPPGFAKEEQ